MLRISAGRTPDLDRLVIGAVGKLEPPQPIVRGRQPDPAVEVTWVQLDRAPEVAFGKREFAGVEVCLAEADVLGFSPAARFAPASRPPGCTVPVELGSSSDGAPAAEASGLDDAPWGASGFAWNMSPSLVELSQPLSQSRHSAIATTVRPRLAPMARSPAARRRLQPAPGRKHATRRYETGAVTLAGEG